MRERRVFHHVVEQHSKNRDRAPTIQGWQISRLARVAHECDQSKRLELANQCRSSVIRIGLGSQGRVAILKSRQGYNEMRACFEARAPFIKSQWIFRPKFAPSPRPPAC